MWENWAFLIYGKKTGVSSRNWEAFKNGVHKSQDFNTNGSPDVLRTKRKSCDFVIDTNGSLESITNGNESLNIVADVDETHDLLVEANISRDFTTKGREGCDFEANASGSLER